MVCNTLKRFTWKTTTDALPQAVAPLYFVVDEKLNSADLTDKGVDWLANQVNDKNLFVLPDITSQLSALENEKDLTDQQRLDKKDDLLNHYAVQSDRVHTLQQLLQGLHYVQQG